MLDKENIRQWLIDKDFSGEGTPPELTDEIRITVIATGLNDDDYPEFYDTESEIDFREKYISHSTSIDDEKTFNERLVEKNKLDNYENH